MQYKCIKIIEYKYDRDTLIEQSVKSIAYYKQKFNCLSVNIYNLTELLIPSFSTMFNVTRILYDKKNHVDLISIDFRAPIS